MAGKFLVPADAGNVFRQGVGIFKPGDHLYLPDAASREGDDVPLKLEPVDDEAIALWNRAQSNREKLAREVIEDNEELARRGLPLKPVPRVPKKWPLPIPVPKATTAKKPESKPEGKPTEGQQPPAGSRAADQ